MLTTEKDFEDYTQRLDLWMRICLANFIVSTHSIWTKSGGHGRGCYFGESGSPAGPFFDFFRLLMDKANNEEVDDRWLCYFIRRTLKRCEESPAALAAIRMFDAGTKELYGEREG